jgi:large subunit ribosomal protein L13
MDMNKSFVLRKEDRQPVWRVIDATDKVLGRLSTEVAEALRGKDKPEFTKHEDAGDYVVVINCSKIKLTGNKWDQKMYQRYSGYRSGLKERTARQVFAKDPSEIIRLAVKGMLPKNRLSSQLHKKLKAYNGSEHPHSAQVTAS